MDPFPGQKQSWARRVQDEILLFPNAVVKLTPSGRFRAAIRQVRFTFRTGLATRSPVRPPL